MSKQNLSDDEIRVIKECVKAAAYGCERSRIDDKVLGKKNIMKRRTLHQGL